MRIRPRFAHALPAGATESSSWRTRSAASKPRNVYRRLWWRAYCLGERASSLIFEDEAVAIMERPSIGGDVRLARIVAENHLRMAAEDASLPPTELLRQVAKRIRRLSAVRTFGATTTGSSRPWSERRPTPLSSPSWPRVIRAGPREATRTHEPVVLVDPAAGEAARSKVGALPPALVSCSRRRNASPRGRGVCGPPRRACACARVCASCDARPWWTSAGGTVARPRTPTAVCEPAPRRSSTDPGRRGTRPLGSGLRDTGGPKQGVVGLVRATARA